MPLPPTISTEELRAQLAFWRVNGVGPKMMQDVVAQYGSISNLLTDRKSAPDALQQLVNKADWAGAEQDLTWLAQPQHHLLLLQAENFPRRLAEITTAPPFIFVKGDTASLQKAQMAMVGSRNPTYYGIKAAQQLSQQLIQAGLTVTSGLALGIDAVCHEVAVKQQVPTIAVLALGLDQVYPKRHQQLAEAILVQGGCLVSEFGVGVKALAENFPRRNRLISGLSLGVLVVEATLKSGSLITARYAAEQGREVFAVPGSIFQNLSQGCHALIKQGAKCVETVNDILLELNGFYPQEITIVDGSKTLLNDPMQSTVLKLLHEVPQAFEHLLEQVECSAATLKIILTQLVLQGLVQETWYGYARLPAG